MHSLTSNTVLTTGKWYCIAVTYDGNNQDLYINSTLDNSQALSNITLTYTNDPLMIGSGTYNNPFNGYVDDLRIYDTALTTTQIADLAGGGCGPGVNPPVQTPSIIKSSPSLSTTVSTNSNSTATKAILSPDTGYGQPSKRNSYLPILFIISITSLILGVASRMKWNRQNG